MSACRFLPAGRSFFGDTVNVASRLETASEPDRVNLSREAYLAVEAVVRTRTFTLVLTPRLSWGRCCATGRISHEWRR